MIDDINFDTVAYQRFPEHRKWFNKLYVAETFGYTCGPAGIPVPVDNNYIVRPIYNLRGLGACASKKYITTTDTKCVPPGYFWVEVFQGRHYSIDYLKVNNRFEQLNCFEGMNDPVDLYKFYSWKKSNHCFTLPTQLANLNVNLLNLEIIGDKIVEVHLRLGMDHLMQYDEIIPTWGSNITEKEGYVFVPCFNKNSDGWINDTRTGYFCK